MPSASKKDFPKIHFYDQDFVDVYDKTWAWIQDCWHTGSSSGGSADGGDGPPPCAIEGKFFSYPGSPAIYQTDAIFSSFFLVYSNKIYHAHPTLDVFYQRQEPSGAIRSAYNIATGLPEPEEGNPEGLGMPLFAWAEYNLYVKLASKKRIKEVLGTLQRYMAWVDAEFKQPNGLYRVPLAAGGMPSASREGAAYPVDFNAQAAVNALYLSKLADVINDKDNTFLYKRQYFALKSRINALMWDPDDGFYHDIDEREQRLPVKTLAGCWPLIAEIPNAEKADRIIAHLQDPAQFGAPHPFPSVALSEPSFDGDGGGGFRGAVYPHLTFMVVKGLERYQRYDLARDCAIRHLYFMLDSMNPGGEEDFGFDDDFLNEGGEARGNAASRGTLWEAYLPTKEGPARWPERPEFPRPQYLTYAGLSTISMTIENIVGLFIDQSRKTVEWIVPSLEIMGIENLALKRNLVTILSNKSGRGWEIHMESEKLYYFTINILGKKRKQLPIPSGKCSMLIDKL